MLKVRNRFTVVWGVDGNLGVESFYDMDGDIFVDSSTDDLSPMLPKKVGNIGSAANKTDSYRCSCGNHQLSPSDRSNSPGCFHNSFYLSKNNPQ